MEVPHMNIEQVEVSALKHAEYNPRILSEEDFAQIKTSIEKFGFVEPIIVNSAKERKNIIIGGNQRYEVAKSLGFKAVPVFYVPLDSLQEEKELNLRLNRNHGAWDWDILANEFDQEFLKSVGFKNFEIESWNMDKDIVGDTTENEDLMKSKIEIKCDSKDEEAIREVITKSLEQFDNVEIE
jgi:hypothetical protein